MATKLTLSYSLVNTTRIITRFLNVFNPHWSGLLLVRYCFYTTVQESKAKVFFFF